MHRDEMLKLLASRSATLWNRYRDTHPSWIPDLSGEDLSWMDFQAPDGAFDFCNVVLFGTKLPRSRSKYPTVANAKLHGAFINALTDAPSFIGQFGVRFVSQSEAVRRATTSTPSVFISYAWAEKAAVLAIDQWLRAKRILTRIDHRDFFAGSSIRGEIVRVMQECNVVLVMYSELASATLDEVRA
jgi:hypothetical protein